jgi:hypothetical protein
VVSSLKIIARTGGIVSNGPLVVKNRVKESYVDPNLHSSSTSTY